MRFILILFFHALTQTVSAADTTRVLFIGNSFTYYNSLPQIFRAFADSSGIPVITAMHAPGGISVGDTAQGSQAHMNNPQLYALIRSAKWDYVVIQDNQGRFVRDSAVFPGSSKVVEGHLKLMDSVKVNNSCAKIVLFAGWAFKNGSPPFGNTGAEMIERILRNYCVLNDSMKEVIAPIGGAWLKVIAQQPAIDLWDPDQAHPSYAGSYLSASVIFSTIFNQKTSSLLTPGPLPAATAQLLRSYSDTVCFGAANRKRFNMNAFKRIAIVQNSSWLSLEENFAEYKWYKDGAYIGNGSVVNLENGIFQVQLTDSIGCTIKSCKSEFRSVGLPEQTFATTVFYPNPVKKGTKIHFPASHGAVILLDASGRTVKTKNQNQPEDHSFDTGELEKGLYILLIEKTNPKKLIID